MKKSNNKLLGTGIITAIAASLCCITPVLALFAGVSGIAAAFSWLEPARPYLIAITILLLGFSWYQKLKPRSEEEIQCDCEEDEKKSFLQSKLFLGIVTVFAVIMLAFPYYADIFYPSTLQKEVIMVKPSDINTVTYNVDGMSCESCNAHIENEVSKLSGIIKVKANYKNGTTMVEFDSSKVSSEKLKEAINSTGYKVIGKK